MIYVILGPTCSHKSKLAELLHKAIKNSIVVNFDAFQVYRELNIGTAKPSKEELATGDYYLYDFLNLTEIYDVSAYQDDARHLLEKFSDRDIIFVGGTGLYIKAALFDYQFLKEDPMSEDYLSELTTEELFAKLEKIDPLDAAKIGNNNRKRLLRALFIYESHQKSKSDITLDGKNKLLYENTKFILLNPDRESLYEDINLRVDEMFEAGLKEEVNDLINVYGKSLRSMQAIGYKEFFDNELSLEEIKELIKKHTRNYAKRQITFFKHQFENVAVYETYLDAYEDLVKKS